MENITLKVNGDNHIVNVDPDTPFLFADYVPKGFHLAPGPIQGHEYGTALSLADRKSLITFLKTL
jgi:hypothetical protein